jgi:predicted amidohydrolase YtcJ
VDEGCVFVNADVHTMDPSRPRTSAVAMAGGRIAGTGDGDQLRAASPGARVVDLGGRVVIPGFVDAHCHFELTTTHLSYAVPLHAPPHSSLRETALRMFTADAAWACHLDDRGVLAPGKLADLVVLGTDPWRVPVDDLPGVTVDQVWIGGERRH